MKKKVMTTAIGLVLSSLFVVGAANAVEQKPAQPAETTNVMVQGVQVAIDPATGRLVAPTAEQRAALSAALTRNAAASRANALNTRGHATRWQRPQTDADAAKTLRRPTSGKYAAVMQLPESMVSNLVAEIKDDGSVAIGHQDEMSTTSTPSAKPAQPAKEVLP